MYLTVWQPLLDTSLCAFIFYCSRIQAIIRLTKGRIFINEDSVFGF